AVFSAEDTLDVCFTITNTGSQAGAEIAQLYVRDEESSLPRPRKELKGFKRVQLAAGEAKTVTLSLDKAAFSFWSPDTGDWVAEAGSFELLVGASSSDSRLSTRVMLG
ncbi:MAG: fibronectin type III-like domain-contianing protein, partial [Gammaproteobacteria bacterium]|nr:fibronectin type III-like domain-contianing protein [Gammaproteobacteria bacterium]